MLSVFSNKHGIFSLENSLFTSGIMVSDSVSSVISKTSTHNDCIYITFCKVLMMLFTCKDVYLRWVDCLDSCFSSKNQEIDLSLAAQKTDSINYPPAGIFRRTGNAFILSLALSQNQFSSLHC